jgi:hypothetical protein
VAHRESIEGDHHIYFEGPLVSFNLLHVNNELDRTPTSAKRVVLHLTDRVTVVDHTSCERLLHFVEECHRNGGARVELVGLDQMVRRSEFPSCMRTRRSRPSGSQNGHRREGYEKMHATLAGTTSESALSRSLTGPVSGGQLNSENGLAWLSLSDPAVTAVGDQNSPHDRRAEAQADMDWLDLERASEPHEQLTRQEEARADMDWIDLERAGDHPSGPSWCPTL